MKFIVIWGATAIISAVLAAFIAPWKNRDYNTWAAWCFIFPPLLIALIISPKSKVPPRRPPSLDEIDRLEHREDRVL